MNVSLPRTGNGPPEKNAVSRSSAAAPLLDLGNPEADADGVVVAPGQRRLEGDAGVDAEVDQIAIARRAHHAREHADARGLSSDGRQIIWSTTP